MNQPLSTPNAMERRFTFAVTAVSKSFSPRPLVAQSPRKNLLAVAVNIQKSKTEETKE